jgi:diguanylate cyclase (GGDEF)-like protein
MLVERTLGVGLEAAGGPPLEGFSLVTGGPALAADALVPGAVRRPGDPDRTGAHELESLLAAVFDESPVPTFRAAVVDNRVGSILEANPAARALFGGARLAGRHLADLAVAGSLMRLGVGPTQHLLSTPNLTGDGLRWLSAWVVPLSPLASPRTPAALVIMHDVTDQRAADSRLAQAARRDPLTGLGNRDVLLRALGSLDRVSDGPQVAVLFCDLDRFKRVNDHRGHQAGDEVLVTVARRVRAAVRPRDTVVRLGGDEFVVLCPRISGLPDARAIAERVRATLQTPMTITGRALRISMSVGLALAPAGQVDPPALLHAADAAMYSAKQAGRNRVGLQGAHPPAAVAAGSWSRWAPIRWVSRHRTGSSCGAGHCR